MIRSSLVGFTAALVAVICLTSSAALAVDCCAFNGGTCTSLPNITHGQSAWAGAVCPTTISGTNCTVTLDADATASSGDCLTIGSGVTVEMAGHTLSCTSSECGYAIKNTNSGNSSAAVRIQNGDITGCWGLGIGETGGTNTAVSDMFIDLGGSCTGSGGFTGISLVQGLIDHAVVKNAKSTGVWLASGKDLKNSMVKDSGNAGPFGVGYGVFLSGSGNSFDNVLLLGNQWNVRVSGVPNMQRSELQNATICNCVDNNDQCIACDTYLNITNGTTPTFIDDAMIP